MFSGPQGGETDLFYNFIAGLQTHLPSAFAVLKPHVNSYGRHVKDHAAPINLFWASDNRKTGIRIPISEAQARGVENIVAGMDCNHFWGIAVSFACGYLGMKNGLRPSKQYRSDAYEGREELPLGMDDAFGLFENASELHELFWIQTYAVVFYCKTRRI